MSALPSDGSPVPEQNHVLRMPRPPPQFVPDDFKPSWPQFQPSSEEKALARSTKNPCRVSVWDEALTTIAQAKAYRGEVALLVLRLEVADVHAVGKAHSNPRVAVVYETLPPEEAGKPGAAGHAGIEGLDRGAGQSRSDWKGFLQEIADRAVVVELPDAG